MNDRLFLPEYHIIYPKSIRTIIVLKVLICEYIYLTTTEGIDKLQIRVLGGI